MLPGTEIEFIIEGSWGEAYVQLNGQEVSFASLYEQPMSYSYTVNKNITVSSAGSINEDWPMLYLYIVEN